MICRRQGKEYQQSYRRGRPLSGLEERKLPRKEAGATGTRVRFLYDKGVFLKGCAFVMSAPLADTCFCGCFLTCIISYPCSTVLLKMPAMTHPPAKRNFLFAFAKRTVSGIHHEV